MTDEAAKVEGEGAALPAAAVPLLDLSGLVVTFDLDDGSFDAVDGVSFSVDAGKTLGIVGESGSGKTMTALSLLRLVPPPGRIAGGVATFEGVDLFALTEEDMRSYRGNRISMIFQEPLTALNPVKTIGEQVAETFVIHRGDNAATALAGAVGILDQVGMPDPSNAVRSYPHQLSGGMRQRAMIAMALACRPRLLIADEPTTALDTTIQAQILDLMIELQENFAMGVVFIGHNLGVVSEVADDILVMYAGRVVERAATQDLFDAPRHPYSQGLIDTLPRAALRGQPLPTIGGVAADMRTLGLGCAFAPRCPFADDQCRAEIPPLRRAHDGRWAACFKVTA